MPFYGGPFQGIRPGGLGGLLFTFIKYQSLIPLCLKLTEKSLACFNCFSLMAGRKERESIDYSEVDKKYYSGFTSRLENTKCVQET